MIFSNKQYYFSQHAIERLSEMKLTEIDGMELLEKAEWYTVPEEILIKKYVDKGGTQLGFFYLKYKSQDRKTPSILFTCREYKDNIKVVTCTKKR
mgnify:CR=1 FL=1